MVEMAPGGSGCHRSILIPPSGPVLVEAESPTVVVQRLADVLTFHIGSARFRHDLGGVGLIMKAGNDARVVLMNDGVPWAVGLGHDAKAKHTESCRLMMDWLGIEEHPATVEDACCRAMRPGRDWGLAEPADPGAASVLSLNSEDWSVWRTKRMAIHPRHLQIGEWAFYGAEQDDDVLVTAWDRSGAALAAFRPGDRKLLADIAEALRSGRLAVVDGRDVGPILVLADRVPGNAFCQAISYIASSLSFDDEGTGIVYAEHPPRLLETCTDLGRGP